MIDWKQDALLAIALLALSAIFYFTALSYPEDVSLFPSYLAPLLAALSGLLLISAFRRRHASTGQSFQWQRYGKVAFITLLILGYAFALMYVGYIFASILLVGIFFLCMHYTNRWVALAIAVGAALLTYLLFAVVLEVPLPTGLFFGSE